LEETLEVNETGLVGSRRFHCAKRGPKRTPIHSLRQFRLGFELQPPPLSGTTLAERLPLRIPGIHDYALLSATESSKHTDVIMVVVLRSRDAVCLPLPCLAGLATKTPACRPAPPPSASRHPHSTLSEPSCLMRFKPLCLLTQPHSDTRPSILVTQIFCRLATPSISRRSALGIQIFH